MSDAILMKSIKEGDIDINVAPEHLYNSSATEVSYYQFRRIPPYSFPVISLNGTCVSEYEITPSQVFNLSKSFLEVDVFIPAQGADTRTFFPIGFCSLIDQIEFLDASGKQLVWVQSPEYYTKIVWPTCTRQEDFLSNTIPPQRRTIETVGGYKTTLLNKNNTLSAVVANTANNFNNGNFVVTNSDPLLTIPSDPYLGVQRLHLADDNNQAMAVRCQIPLNMFYGTLLSCNRDLYFGQTMVLRVTWNNGSKMGFTMATTQANYGNIASATTAPLVVVPEFKSSDRLRLALQNNPIAAESIKKKVLTEGLHLNIPFVWSYKYSLTGAVALPGGAVQTLIRKINKNHGQRLLRVWTGMFSNSDSGGAYYCQNYNGFSYVSAGGGALPAITANDNLFSQVWAQLDGNNLQESNLVNQNGEIYEFLSSKLDKSAGGSFNQYIQSAFMLNDFTPVRCVDFADNDLNVNGLSLNEEREYSINFLAGQAPAGNPTNLFYMFIVTQRLLSINREGVMFA